MATASPQFATMLLTKEHLDAMGRRRFQSPKLQQTEGEKPKWFCRYYKDVRHANGKLDRVEDRKYFGFVHEVKPTAAKRLLADFTARLNAGEFGVTAKATIAEWVPEFKTLHYPTLKASSQALYDKHIRNHVLPAVGNVTFGEIDKLTIQRFANRLVERKLASETRKVIMGVLKAIIHTAEDAGLYDGPDLIEEVRELRASNIRLLCALRLLTPADGWAGYEDAEGNEIGTLVQAAIDGAGEDEELRELRADKERLDWLEFKIKHHGRIGLEADADVNMPIGIREVGWFEDYDELADAETLRAAIDAARKEQAC